MAEVNIDVAKEESVQAVITKVGTSSDTASSTPTTLFAGIKGLIAWFTGTWTAGRAAKIDTIDTNAVNIINYVGTTTNTGGTTTAGTAMAKLNALLTNMTSTRAGYIDTIKSLLENATYGLSALKTAITGGSVPIVNSVQMGRYHNTNYAYTASNMEEGILPTLYIDLLISSINLAKSIVIVNSSPYGSAGGQATGRLINSTTLRLYPNYYTGTGTAGTMVFSNVCWEVVEFY